MIVKFLVLFMVKLLHFQVTGKVGAF